MAFVASVSASKVPVALRRRNNIAASLPPPIMPADFSQNRMAPREELKSVWAGTTTWEALAAANCMAPRRNSGLAAVSVAEGMWIVVLAVLVA